MKFIFYLCFLSLGACSLAPKYLTPVAPIPDRFEESGARPDDSIKGQSEPSIADWRQHFNDSNMKKVIEAALKHNRDLRIATLRVDEYRALNQIQRADQIPSLEANGGFSRGKQIDPVSGRGSTASLFQGSVGLTVFELDFFGRVKSLSDAALSRYLATEAARSTVQITLIADTANAYIRELSLAQQEQLSQETLASREFTHKIDESRLRSGVSNLLEMKTSEMLVESARAGLSEVKREREQNRNALRILVGSFDFNLERTDLRIEDIKFPELRPGLPSSLLSRRPDIIQSESLLKAANANIGAARAAFFPSISLTSNIGSVSSDFDGLFKSGSETWTFRPQINIPIFSGGRNRSNLEAANIRKDIAIAQYEQAIQNSFREVKDYLLAHDLIMVQVAAQKAVRDADADRSRLAQKRYERGVSGYLEYLDAQRSHFDSDKNYLKLNELRLNNDIALYRALGGGWK